MSASNKEESKTPIIVIVALVTAISLLGDSMLYIVLPLYWKEAGLDSIWQVGILLSINRFIRLPFNPLVGWLYNKITLKTGLIIAIILGSITTLGYGLFTGFIAWIILRSVWGIAWSFFRIGGLSVVAFNTEENNRGKSIGLYNGLHRLGSLFGMLIGGLLVPILGLSAVSIIFGCLTLLGLPLILLYVKTNSLMENKQDYKVVIVKERIVDRLKQGRGMIIFTGFCITLLIQGIFISTLSSVIEHFHGERVTLFGSVISASFLAGILLSVRWLWEPFLGAKFGVWSDGVKGRVPVLVLSLLFASLTFGSISYDLPLVLMIFFTFLVMIAATSLTTIVDAIALDLSKNTNVVSFLTTYTVAQDLGASVGPFISFMVFGLTNGISYVYWGGAGMFLMLAILWSKSYRRERRNTTSFLFGKLS
ncbi:MFS transporter [Sporosarcina thermotolerans]|uniref:MFS transporter n=1 Tax=Sporosarcina thermotolerans TaxID=633404 RepID=A0AAW9AAT2_9BACL|nr:MFS transporter [Sporosarcina thermotolerans]MDW0118517.1 MFS transporter [Sporosarcina thermotolerans]WHT49534.1 MFS transporter [Sporosarcina thermotolerans]